MLSRLQSLVGRRSSRDEHALAEELEAAEAEKHKSKARFFVMQTLEALKKLELEGGTYICSSPDFECYFKKKSMPLFEEKNAYVKVAFDKAENVTHVCGLLPRLQHEKERNKTKDENLTLSKMPGCLLSQAIAEMSRAPQRHASRAGNVVHHGQTASTGQQVPRLGDVVHRGQAASAQQQNSRARSFQHQGQVESARKKGSSLVYDPNASGRSLKGPEQEWLESMQAALVDGEYEILLHLLQHSIVAHGFREKIQHFLVTRQELQPGSCSEVIDSFKYLANEFRFSEQVISVAQIGSSLEGRLYLVPREIFSVIVELFFCLGYEREIKGYTTGFVEVA